MAAQDVRRPVRSIFSPRGTLNFLSFIFFPSRWTISIDVGRKLWGDVTSKESWTKPICHRNRLTMKNTDIFTCLLRSWNKRPFTRNWDTLCHCVLVWKQKPAIWRDPSSPIETDYVSIWSPSLTQADASILDLTWRRVRTGPAPFANQLRRYWALGLFPGCVTVVLVTLLR